jgi:hypothetical protein
VRFADASALDWQALGGDPRSDDDAEQSLYKDLLRGDPDSPQNYWLILCQIVGNPPTPRHRHNFEQIRYLFSGHYSVIPGRVIEPETVAYFPEAAYYGPEEARDDPTMLVLQFGGVSGNGFLSATEIQRGVEELAELGTYEEGMFRPHDGGEEKDGFEAVWEHVRGRSIDYPTPRYDTPIQAAIPAFEWRPLNGNDGVSVKRLGVFTEADCEVRFLRLEAGASYEEHGDGRPILLYVRDGDVRVGSQDASEEDAVEIENGETVTVEGRTQAHVLAVSLPRLDAASTGSHNG